MDLIDRFRAATDPHAAARILTDSELTALWNGLDEEPDHQHCRALSAEIERRELDL